MMVWFVVDLFVFLVLLRHESDASILDEKKVCTSLSELDDLEFLSQEQFTSVLTDPCRYDKNVKPSRKHVLPVFIQMDLNHMQKVNQVQFNAIINVQYRYEDVRLKFANLSSWSTIFGGETLKNKIWIPHVMMKNEKSTKMIDFGGSNVIVAIEPNGQVAYSYTMSTTFYCWMNLKKFPFDSQNCSLTWTSWTYNATDVRLHWDKDLPIKVDEKVHLPEFLIDAYWTEEAVSNEASPQVLSVSNFSELKFTFKLHREVGFYMMEYFLPSILLVCTSWVSFWLQADATPPRAILGASTFLAFITLNGGLAKNLPKVSYIKASDVWFLACSCFIFGSLAEFAFANVIWRRNKRIELRKNNGREILRSAITPSIARKHIRKAQSMAMLYRERPNGGEGPLNSPHQHYLTVDFPERKASSLATLDLRPPNRDVEDTFVAVPTPSPNDDVYTMTPQEVSIWIDRKARIVFPIAFAIFNFIYWSIVYTI